jgi:hypothetical protein
MAPGLSPSRMRIATEAARRLPSITECIGPPTIARSKKASLCEKMGAVATAWSLVNALSPSCTTPAASTFITDASIVQFCVAIGFRPRTPTDMVSRIARTSAEASARFHDPCGARYAAQRGAAGCSSSLACQLSARLVLISPRGFCGRPLYRLVSS